LSNDPSWSHFFFYGADHAVVSVTQSSSWSAAKKKLKNNNIKSYFSWFLKPPKLEGYACALAKLRQTLTPWCRSQRMCKVDFQSVLRRLNGSFCFFCFKKLLTSCTTLWNVPIRDLLHKLKLQFLSPAIMDVSVDVSFTLDEIEERDIEVAVQPGRDNILVCTCTGFCLRETGRNACLCRSAQQLPSSTRNRKQGNSNNCYLTVLQCTLIPGQSPQ